MFDNQFRSRRKLLDSLKEGIGRRCVAIAEKQIERRRIDPGFLLSRLKHGPYLRAEIQPVSFYLVIDQFDTEGIARQEEPCFGDIPDRQPEHPVQTVENLISPLLISMHDDFGIGIRPKHMAARLQFAPQLFKIVDFAVEHHPYGFCLIRHGLVSAAEIDDRETPEAEAERTGQEKAFVVRPSMDQRSGHSLGIVKPDRSMILKIILAANPAHTIIMPSRISCRARAASQDKDARGDTALALHTGR